MTNIKNMTQLRNKVLQALEDLEEGKIDIDQASCMAKLSETAISGLKAEMQYAIITKTQAYIPFFENNENRDILIEHDTIKKLK